MKTIGSTAVFAAFGLSIWAGLNGSFSVAVAGAGIATIAVILLLADTSVFGDVRITPGAFIALFAWLAVFLVALVRSNIDVLRRVLSPRLPINPGIVAVKTRLKSRLGRLALANAITLTPGTLTVDVQGETLYIHWIDVTAADVNAATEQIVAKFEIHLEKLFG